MTTGKAAFLLAWAGTMVVAQQSPLSAIDWLDELAATPIAQPMPQEPAVTDTATTPDVAVMPLGSANSDAVGLLPSTTTGLPASIWINSKTTDVIREISWIADDPLPALQALYYTVLLAEADAPADVGNDSSFLKARLAALTDFGAVDPARALVERAGADTPELFDDWLDLSLLAGTEDDACKALRDKPDLSRSYSARIYCTARAGDWPTAALVYDTAVGLDALNATDTTLLALFLDPEAIDETPLPQAPSNMPPLTFRLFEAAGAPYPTTRLPRAFAMADLRETAGWRAEIEAAERLTRTGALPANRLLGLYTDGKPAASGGVWDRVRAVQAFDTALQRKDTEAVARTLPPAWRAMKNRGLGTAFAQLFASKLRDLDLPNPVRRIAFTIILLSDEYETAGTLLKEPDITQKFLIDLASGAPNRTDATTRHEQAIALGFSSIQPTGELAQLIEAGKIGQAILAATNQLDRARDGNMSDLTGALAALRSLGLEDTARRAALQILLLEQG